MIRLKKISAKTVIGNKDEIKNIVNEADGKRVDLFDVFGVVKGMKTGESDSGPWVGFKGLFESYNHHTGETAQATEFFPPPVVSEMMETAYMHIIEKHGEDTRKEQGDGTRKSLTVFAKKSDEQIQVAMTVYAKKADTATGYEYGVEEKIAPAPVDAIENVKKLAGWATPDRQISAPKPEGGTEKKETKKKKG